MLDVSRVSSKGQITIPLDIRKRLGIKKGDKIAFIEKDNGFAIVHVTDVSDSINAMESQTKNEFNQKNRLIPALDKVNRQYQSTLKKLSE